MIGLMVFFVFALNQGSETKENFDKMYFEAEYIMGYLLSESYPNNWGDLVGTANQDDIKVIGLLNNDRINDSKLIAFYKFANGNGGIDYGETKVKFNLKYNYHYYLILDTNGIITDKDMDCDGDLIYDDCNGIGNDPNSPFVPGSPVNLIKITRLTIYNGRPAVAYLYLWQQ
jgi:hypothetical protein